MATIKELRAEHLELFGEKALNKLKAEELQAKIDRKKAFDRERLAEQEQKVKAKADREARQAMRAAADWHLTAARGEDKDEARVVWLFKRATTTVEAYPSLKAKFMSGFDGDAGGDLYALSWSASFFAQAANCAVHKELLFAIGAGSSLDQIKSWLTDLVLNAASHVPASTSFSSNAVDAHKTAAAAQVLRDINFY